MLMQLAAVNVNNIHHYETFTCNYLQFDKNEVWAQRSIRTVHIEWVSCAHASRFRRITTCTTVRVFMRGTVHISHAELHDS
jgi:hypothetical protein